MMKIANKILLTIRSKGYKIFILSLYYYLLRNIYFIIKKKFIIKNIYNYKMKLDVFDLGISKTLIVFGQRELDQKYILELVLKEEMTVLDIGANIGYYALMELGIIGKLGMLIAVEPSSDNIILLRDNLKLNNYKNHEIHHAAISDKKDQKIFYLSNMSNLNTFHIDKSDKLFLSGKTEKVKTYTVSQIAKNRHIDLIRMDVEGHEVEIFNGLIDDIENGKLFPIIIFEPHTSRYNSRHDLSNVLNRLFKCGYGGFLVSSNSEKGSKIIESFKYNKIKSIKTDDVIRSVYQNIKNIDLEYFLTKSGGLRTVVLKKIN